MLVKFRRKFTKVAWAGPDVAKAGIDFIRWINPNLDTSEIEDNVCTLVGGLAHNALRDDGDNATLANSIGGLVLNALRDDGDNATLASSVRGLVYNALRYDDDNA